MSLLLDALRSTLVHPTLYLALQYMLGAHKARIFCVERIGLQPGERVLDIGCGPGYVLDYMPDVQYFGFDTEPRYIAYARRKYGARGTFYCDHFSNKHEKEIGGIDAVLLMAILHHLPDDQCLSLLEDLLKVLNPGGRVISMDPCFIEGQDPLARLMAKNDRGQYVRTEQQYLDLIGTCFPARKGIIAHNLGWVPSTSIVMEFQRQ